MPKLNKKAVNSVPYTKAGLLSKSGKKSNNSENAEPKESDMPENTPASSKQKSTEHDDSRAVH